MTVIPDRSLTDVVAGVAVLVGLVVLAYGLLLVPQSALGGLWVAAIGVALAASGVLATDRAAARLGADTARRLSLAAAVLAVVLLVAFAAVNGATFEPGSADGGSAQG